MEIKTNVLAVSTAVYCSAEVSSFFNVMHEDIGECVPSEQESEDSEAVQYKSGFCINSKPETLCVILQNYFLRNRGLLISTLVDCPRLLTATPNRKYKHSML